jgi:hypothetical protein
MFLFLLKDQYPTLLMIKDIFIELRQLKNICNIIVYIFIKIILNIFN